MAQQNESEPLIALEHLMNEFFHSTTNNIRKREIESQLASFSNQKESWKLCIYFLTNTENQYVCMFAMTSLESTINRLWTGLKSEEKAQIKTELWMYLTREYATSSCIGPTFLRNKLAKLIVDIARHDWPHFYPDFFNNIIELIQSEQGRVLGLIILRVASEELGNPRDDLSYNRKIELFRLMQSHAHAVLQHLTVLLQDIANKKDVLATKTPPPSPTHPNSAPLMTTLTEASTLRPDSREICFEILMALQHMFSWVSLKDIDANLLKTIFHFATSMSYTQDDDNICVLSLTTLSELLYRKVIPPGCESLLLQLSSGAAQLLSHILSDTMHPGSMESLSNSFIEKLTEFIQLLIETHLKRLEGQPSFSIIDFINLLFRYTFQQPSICQFIPCLGIWTTFLRQVKPKNGLKTGIIDQNFKYSEAVFGIANAVLNKMQYQFNRNELNELDQDVHENEFESEFQQFIDQSIELLANISEIAPVHMLNLVLTAWLQKCEIYLTLSSILDQSHSRLIVGSDQEGHLQIVLRDFITLSQTLSRLATCFMDQDEDYYEFCTDTVKNLYAKLMTTLFYTIEYKLYNLSTSASLRTILCEVLCTLLTTVASWCLWPNFRTDISTGQLGCEMIRACTHLLLTPISPNQNVPDKVARLAALLFLRLSTLCSPQTFLELPTIGDLIHCASIHSKFEPETAGIIRQALCNIAIKPHTNHGSDQLRGQLLTSVIDGLTGSLRNLQNNMEPQHARVLIETIVPQMITFIEQYGNHPSSVKKLLCDGLTDSIEWLLLVYPRYAAYPEINDHILTLFLTLLDVLRQQLGVEFTKRAVLIFLNVSLSKQNESDVCGMDKLLQILQLIVEEPGISFRCLLPSIIDLCLQTALPIVGSHSSELPDLSISLYKLLHSILLHRWQFFKQSQVRLGHSPGASDAISGSEAVVQHTEQFIQILEAFGRALLQPDINIFKLSLQSLEDLNSKWKLYYNDLFRKQLLGQFLTVLLQTLLNKSHALLSDEITSAIYNMVTVDWQAFLSTFLPNFLDNSEGLDCHQKQTLLRNFNTESDMPTLTQNVSRLITDMRCYRICNASLSSESVLL